ncbi:uncharacterized protein [Temnothorax longispinosus]|uniref:uncharacterized protein n=1 Tax=Temnothorax longispinosus TaxID=300112 RepID=UPI003A9A3C42
MRQFVPPAEQSGESARKETEKWAVEVDPPDAIVDPKGFGGNGPRGTSPLELAARQYAEVYRRERELRAGVNPVLPRARRAIRLQERTALIERWRVWLDNAKFGRRTVDAVRPCLAERLDSRRLGLSFHAVQVLTGHGCFGEYLCRIGREATTKCHHCDEERDTAQHTLAHRPAWTAQRRVLQGEIGQDLSLPAMVAAMVGNESKWRAFTGFCGAVMARKEEAERIRRVPGLRGIVSPNQWTGEHRR